MTDGRYYFLVDDSVRDNVRAKIRGEPRVWSCPCGGSEFSDRVFFGLRAESGSECGGRVFYGRSADGHIFFEANMTSDPAKHFMHRIDNAEDFQAMMDYATVPEADRMLFAIWLNMGLREALLSAPSPEIPS